MQRFDMHCHVAPADYLAAVRSGDVNAGISPDSLPGPEATAEWSATPDVVQQWLGQAELDAAVMSIVPAVAPRSPDSAAMREATRSANESLLAWQSQGSAHGVSFRMLATLPTVSGVDAAAELRWAMPRGFVGAQIDTMAGPNCGLDAEDLEPFWEAVDELNALVFVHPFHPHLDARYDAHYLRNLAGNPMEAGMAVAALVFGGIIERWPDLRLVVSHGGGTAAGLVGRWDRGATARSRMVGNLSALPSELMGRIHFDTITHDAALLASIERRWGIERLVIGTDRPFPMGDGKPIDSLRAAGFSPDMIDVVSSVNPARLLGNAAPSEDGGTWS